MPTAFNIPVNTGKEEIYVQEALINALSKNFHGKCLEILKKHYPENSLLLTSSGTASLEMVALLLNLKEGDEVIMPSFTFVSSASSMALRGAKCVFVDIKPDTLNIDENIIEAAITKKTKALLIVHYAGVACNMEKIQEICKKHKIPLIEDAAHCIGAKYKGKALGSFGDFGTISFDHMKNLSAAGDGGLLIIKDKNLLEKAEIIAVKGTNQAKFVRGEVSKYEWIAHGSYYTMGSLNSAYLYAGLENLDKINAKRIKLWNMYYNSLKEFEKDGLLKLPTIPNGAEHNAHIFWVSFSNSIIKEDMIEYLKKLGITAQTHYAPLHKSPAGKDFGRFCGTDKNTSKECRNLLRLPLYYNLEEQKVREIVGHIKDFIKDYISAQDNNLSEPKKTPQKKKTA